MITTKNSLSSLIFFIFSCHAHFFLHNSLSNLYKILLARNRLFFTSHFWILLFHKCHQKVGWNVKSVLHFSHIKFLFLRKSWSDGHQPNKICSSSIIRTERLKTLVSIAYKVCPHHLYQKWYGPKCEGNCGLWVLNEIIKKTYPENLKKILGAVWELPAK